MSRTRARTALDRIFQRAGCLALFVGVRKEMEAALADELDAAMTAGALARQRHDAGILTRKAGLYIAAAEAPIYRALKAAEDSIRQSEMPL